MNADKPLVARLTGLGGPFELHELSLNGNPVHAFRTGPQTLIDIFRRSRTFAEKPFVVWGGKTSTYAEIFSHADALTEVLTSTFAVKKGMRVGLFMENQPAWLAAFIAISSAGAVAVIAPVDDTARLRAIIAQSKSALVLTDEPTGRRLRDAREQTPVLTANGVTTCTHLDQTAPPSIQPDDGALIAFTSGTTGPPKGVRHTHRSVVTGLRNMMLGAALAPRKRGPATTPPARPPLPTTMVLSPLSYIAGYAQFLLAMMIAGKIVLPQSSSVTDICRLIEREQVRTLSGASPNLIAALAQTRREDANLDSLAAFNLFGGAVQTRLVKDIRDRFPAAALHIGYGMTETSGSIAVGSVDDAQARPRAAGRLLPTVQIRIDTARASGVGEILVRGAMVMLGYCTQVERPATALEDGWFRTGDVGYVEDGYLCVIDRLENTIVINDDVIALADIENALLVQLPIAEVAVVASDRHRSPLHLHVAVAPRVAAPDSAARLVDLLRAQLGQAIEVSLVEVAELPRTPSGKVNRAALRAVVRPLDALD